MILLENRNILFFGCQVKLQMASPWRWCSFTLSGAKAETTRGQWKNEGARDEKNGKWEHEKIKNEWAPDVDE